MKIFVYGTLKQGHGNHRLLQESTKLGADWLAGYKMHSYGGFPVVYQGEGMIYGEFYEIDDVTLERCDWLEGHPDFYKRVQDNDPRYGDFWIYIQTEEECQHLSEVEGGMW